MLSLWVYPNSWQMYQPLLTSFFFHFTYLCLLLHILPYILSYSSELHKQFSISQCGICISHCEICIPHCGFYIPQCETENLLWNFSFYIMRMIRNRCCYFTFICFSFCGYKERQSFVLNKNVYIIVINCFVSVWYLLHLPLNIIK